MARISTAKKSKQFQNTEDTQLEAQDPFDLSTLATCGPALELVTDSDKARPRLWEDPAFLNETMVIQFLDTGDINAPKLVELLVNTVGADGKTGGKSVRLAFKRNTPYKIPRYVFEVIAHAKITTLQQTEDPRDPMNIRYVERHSFYYPCQVLHDPNPKGPAWCEHVLKSAA